jgi:membrane protease YdiL (CAAX protease family)
VAEAAPDAPTRSFPPKKGVLYAVAGILIGVVASNIAFAIVIVATGRTIDETDDLPLSLVALLQVPLWLGLLGVPLWVSARKGSGTRIDYGLWAEKRDVVVGLAWGIGTQLILVPALYAPLIWIFELDTDKLDDPAKSLTDRADNPVGVILLILVVAIGAPIIEEIFYRGLLQRSLLRLLPAPVAIGITAVVFGGSHLELLQLPALVMFGVIAGVLAHRSGRLGPSIACHVGFNAVTVIALLAAR